VWAVTEVRKKVTGLVGQVSTGPLVVGCSGGPDSLVLADAVLAADASRTTLVYVDHGLRPEAAGEGARVVAFAEAAGARGRVVRVTVERDGRGLEDAARRARHAALLAVADEVGARWVLLGHTASDQAETVLSRLLRGAGANGLAGMAPRRGRFLRPLLDVPRATILAYAAARGLEPTHDPMNDDRAFARARLRHDVLPFLRRENPRVDEALVRTARALRETADALDWAVARAAAELGPGLPVEKLAALPAAIAKRLLAERAAALGASLEARHLDAIWKLVGAPARGSAELHLPGLVVRREYAELRLVVHAPTHAEVTVEGPDEPYLVRTWQPGDRMRPSTLKGRSRKLQDLFTDRKIAAAARRRAVVVVRAADGVIVWAEHIGPAVDEAVRVALTRRDPPVI